MWTGDRVLLPYVFDYTSRGTNPNGRPEPTGGLLDVRTGSWTRLPSAPPLARNSLHVEATSRGLVTAGEGLVLDVRVVRWHVLLPADGAPTEGVTAAWVGRQLVVFGGGSTSGATRSLTATTHVWTAPN